MNKIKKRIVFIVDGNSKIGLGHVYRSLNLAKELVKSSQNILFLTNDSLVKKLVTPYFDCKLFSKLTDSKNSVITKDDLVIIDKLEESYRKLYKFRSQSNMMVGIDYIGANKQLFSKGINILYQNTGIRGSKSYSGFQYAILNSHFFKTKPIRIRKKPKSLVIMQGGSDSYCFIPKIINSIFRLDDQLSITVIVGPAFDCEKKLQAVIKKNTNRLISIKRNLKNMSQEIIKHDIAITGGGMTLLELCKLGIPSIVVCTEKFENETASVLQNAGFGVNLGYYKEVTENKIVNATKMLIENYKLRCNMNKSGQKIIDGNGTRRVSCLIKEWVRKN